MSVNYFILIWPELWIYMIHLCVVPFTCSCSWLVCPSARVNKRYVNVNVKGSISAADRKRNNQGFFYSSIINEDWRLIYRLITRQHREWCRGWRGWIKGGECKELTFCRNQTEEVREKDICIDDLISYESMSCKCGCVRNLCNCPCDN